MFWVVLILCLDAAVAFTRPLIGSGKAFLYHRRHHHSSFRASNNHDRFDMDELRQRMEQEMNPHRFILRGDNSIPHMPERVFVILFHPGTDRQGFHSIEFPKGSGNNLILAFESEVACHNFASMLKKQNFFEPEPQEFDLEYLKTVGDTLGVSVQIVPTGVDVMPPTQNVATLGHNPRLKREKGYLNYLFEKSDDWELEEVGVLTEASNDRYTSSWE